MITFSHFLSRRDLLLPVSRLSFKRLTLVAGASALDRQTIASNSVIHVFGHRRINCDQVIAGARYAHNAFGCPREERILKYHLK